MNGNAKDTAGTVGSNGDKLKPAKFNLYITKFDLSYKLREKRSKAIKSLLKKDINKGCCNVNSEMKSSSTAFLNSQISSSSSSSSSSASSPTSFENLSNSDFLFQKLNTSNSFDNSSSRCKFNYKEIVSRVLKSNTNLNKV